MKAIPYLLTSLLFTSLLLAACDRQTEEQATADAKMDHSHHESVAAAEPSDQSIYQLESRWQTQTGREVSLRTLGGKPQVLAMVYASCKNACPRIIADMKRIQADSEAKHKAGVRFVLVSIDPEVDTPQRLAALARKSQLDGQWLLLRGKPDDVLELAALLGVRYRKISDRDYVHSNLITVLNAKGEIVQRQQGLGVEPAATLAALDKLLLKS